MAVGDVYDARYGVDWADGNSQVDPPRGYYPRLADGSVDHSVRLRWVDATPDDPEDNTGYFVVMAREAGYGYFHGRDGELGVEDIAPGPVAPLAAQVEGRASLASRMARALRINYVLRRK